MFNIDSNTPKKERKMIGACTLILGGIIAGSLLSGNATSSIASGSLNTSTKTQNAESYEAPLDKGKEDNRILASSTNESVEFVPMDIPAKDIIETEVTNLKANEDNADRKESDIVKEATAISQLNTTDNKAWNGKVELWVDGTGWVDASTLTDEEIVEITGAPTVSLPQNLTQTTGGHYEEQWIVEIPAYDEPEYKTISFYVCNGCGKDLGTEESDMDAHCRAAMLSGNAACGSWSIYHRSEPTGNVIHHEEQGRYEKVWVAN